jgi:hypothetical protein
MTRLQAVTMLPINQWRFHEAMLPHGEEPSLDESGWKDTPVTYSERRGSDAGPGPEQGWYRATVEVPPTVGGKAVYSHCRLDRMRSRRWQSRFRRRRTKACRRQCELSPVNLTFGEILLQKIRIDLESESRPGGDFKMAILHLEWRRGHGIYVVVMFTKLTF